MTNDEAMKLAHKLVSLQYSYPAMERDGRKLAQFILSGSMKREIANAAYERALAIVDNFGFRAARFGDDVQANFARCADHIRALIQPPAQQKENGE